MRYTVVDAADHTDDDENDRECDDALPVHRATLLVLSLR
jgi:hypothetical protein